MKKTILILTFIFLKSLTAIGDVIIDAHAFDFDDTIMFTASKIFIYRNAKLGEESDPNFKIVSGKKVIEVAVSTRDFAEVGEIVGKPGEYENFFFIDNDLEGSFRHFRDIPGRNTIIEIFELGFELGPSIGEFNRRLGIPELRELTFIITARGQEDALYEALLKLKNEGVLIDVPPKANIRAVGTKKWSDKGIGTEQAKVFEMRDIIGLVKEKVKNKSKATFPGKTKIKGRFTFSDDDYQNIQKAQKGLLESLDSWNNEVEVFIDYVGTRREGITPYKIELNKCTSVF